MSATRALPPGRLRERSVLGSQLHHLCVPFWSVSEKSHFLRGSWLAFAGSRWCVAGVGPAGLPHSHFALASTAAQSAAALMLTTHASIFTGSAPLSLMFWVLFCLQGSNDVVSHLETSVAGKHETSALR
jgi:hypothetical protein